MIPVLSSVTACRLPGLDIKVNKAPYIIGAVLYPARATPTQVALLSGKTPQAIHTLGIKQRVLRMPTLLPKIRLNTTGLVAKEEKNIAGLISNTPTHEVDWGNSQRKI